MKDFMVTKPIIDYKISLRYIMDIRVNVLLNQWSHIESGIVQQY